MPREGLAAWAGGAPADRRRMPYVVGVGLLAALYTGFAQLGYALSFSGPVAAIVWLPVGAGAAFLYLAGPQYWPGIVIGDLLANDYAKLPLGSALGQTCGNTLEVLTIALLLRRLVRDGSPLDSIGNLRWMFVAIAAGCAVSSVVGPVSLLSGGVIAAHEVPQVGRTWWLGDSAGALVVLPLALAWTGLPSRLPTRRRALEAAATLAAVLGGGALALGGSRPLAYLVFPGLIWSALRFGRHGATLAVAITSALALWGTTHHVGPFAYSSISHRVLSTQLFIEVAALTTLCLAAVVAERRAVSHQLDASRVRVIAAADAERLRIEHNLHDGAQQRLAALAVRLGMAAEVARADGATAPPMARALDAAQAELQLAIDELRELARGVHPTVLVELGLPAAIAGLATRSPVPLDVLALPAGRLDEAAEATAYYVIAEAVTNAHKHAGASAIGVSARVSPTGHGDVLDVEVTDDGVGGAAEHGGSGLEGLRDRVESVGGRFTVGNAAAGGTRIAAAIPTTARPARL